MKLKITSVVVLAVLASLVFASVAFAGSAGTTDDIIKDAQDGTLDGNYTAAQVQAALAYLRANPTLQQYTDVGPVLEGYLASLGSPGVAGAGGLKFTGSEVQWLFGLGIALIAGGFALRRKVTA